MPIDPFSKAYVLAPQEPIVVNLTDANSSDEQARQARWESERREAIERLPDVDQALVKAIDDEDEELCRKLLARGANASLRLDFAERSSCPLSMAAHHLTPLFNIVPDLLAAGADPAGNPQDGDAAIKLIWSHGRAPAPLCLETARMLYKARGSLDGDSLAKTAIAAGRWGHLVALVDEGLCSRELAQSLFASRLGSSYEEGPTPDQMAALLYDPKARAPDGLTKAMRLAARGNIEGLHGLHMAGERFDALCPDGGLAEDYAAGAGFPYLARRLRQWREGAPEALPLWFDHEKETKSMAAALGMTDKDMFESHGPLMASDHGGLGALLLRACVAGDLEGCEALLAQGASPLEADLAWISAVEYAAASGSEECVRALAEAGAPMARKEQVSTHRFELPGMIRAMGDHGSVAYAAALAGHFGVVAAAQSLGEVLDQKMHDAMRDQQDLETMWDLGMPRMGYPGDPRQGSHPSTLPHHFIQMSRANDKETALRAIEALQIMLGDGPIPDKTLHGRSLALLAESGFEALALSLARRIADAGVDLGTDGNGYANRSIATQADQEGWTCGGAWMRGYMGSKRDEEALRDIGGGSEPTPKRPRRGL